MAHNACGHHYLPCGVLTRLAAEEPELFSQLSTDYIKVAGGYYSGKLNIFHYFDRAHRKYNKEVYKMLVEFLSERKDKSVAVTSEEMFDFIKKNVKEGVGINGEVYKDVRNYNSKIGGKIDKKSAAPEKLEAVLTRSDSRYSRVMEMVQKIRQDYEVSPAGKELTSHNPKLTNARSLLHTGNNARLGIKAINSLLVLANLFEFFDEKDAVIDETFNEVERIFNNHEGGTLNVMNAQALSVVREKLSPYFSDEYFNFAMELSFWKMLAGR